MKKEYSSSIGNEIRGVHMHAFVYGSCVHARFMWMCLCMVHAFMRGSCAYICVWFMCSCVVHVHAFVYGSCVHARFMYVGISLTLLIKYNDT